MAIEYTSICEAFADFALDAPAEVRVEDQGFGFVEYQGAPSTHVEWGEIAEGSGTVTLKWVQEDCILECSPLSGALGAGECDHEISGEVLEVSLKKGKEGGWEGTATVSWRVE